jgi:hypothetical protein
MLSAADVSTASKRSAEMSVRGGTLTPTESGQDGDNAARGARRNDDVGAKEDQFSGSVRKSNPAVILGTVMTATARSELTATGIGSVPSWAS